MLVTLSEMKKYLKINDSLVNVKVEAKANGATYDKTVTGNGVDTIEQLFGTTDYNITQGNNVILGIGKTLSTTGGSPSTKSLFEGSVANATMDKWVQDETILYSDAIELYCRRKFKKQDYVQIFYKSDYERNICELFTYQYPINSVTSIINLQDNSPIIDYRIVKDIGKIIRVEDFVKVPWFGDAEVIQITYSAGYEDIPVVLQNVVKKLVGSSYDSYLAGVSNLSTAGLQSISVAGVMSISYDTSNTQSEEKSQAFSSMLKGHFSVLDAYRSSRTIIPSPEDLYVI